MNVVAYLRVSGKSQVDGDGFPRQLEAVQKLCAANGLTLIDTVQEEGVSGTVESLDRPAFSVLIDRIENGYEKIEAIVVESASRLARDLLVGEVLLRECRTRKIQVFAADQGAVDIASNDCEPSRKLIRQVLGAVAEYEKSALVAKLAAARKRTGRFGGPARFGERPGDDVLIKTIQGWRDEGQSFNRITQTLNDLGIPNRNGNKWDLRTLRRTWVRREARLNAAALTSSGKTEHT